MKRLLSILLSLLVVMSTLPSMAFAFEPGENNNKTANLNECVGEFKLLDDAGKELPTDGTAKVNPFSDYTFSFEFIETDKKQFANECTYTIPEQLEISKDVHQAITLDDKDGGAEVGMVTATKGSDTVTVSFYDVSEAQDGSTYWPDLGLESIVRFEFSGKFKLKDVEGGNKIDIGAGTTITVEVVSKAGLNVNKSKDGDYDPKNHTQHFKVEVIATGDVADVEIEDSFDADLELVPGSFTVDGVAPTTAPVQKTNGFTLALGDMTNKQKIEVGYTVKIKDSEIYKNASYNKTLNNTVTARGEAVVPVRDNSSFRVDKKNLEKSGKLEKFDMVDGDTVHHGEGIKWTIKVCPDGDTAIGGGTIVDVPDRMQYLELPVNWDGAIKIVYVTAQGETKTAYASDLANITIPADAVSATLTYYTSYAVVDVNANLAGLKFTNEARVTFGGHSWTYTARVDKEGTLKPGLHVNKAITSADADKGEDGKLHYVLKVTVPKDMNKMDSFYIKDRLMFVDHIKGVNELYVTNNIENIKISVSNTDGSGTTAYESYSAFKEPGHPDNVFFCFGGKDITDPSKSKWPDELGVSDKTLTIEYDVPRSSDLTMRDGNLNDMLKHADSNILLNEAWAYYSYDGESYSSHGEKKYKETSEGYIKKKVSNVNTGKHTITYAVEFNPMLDSDIDQDKTAVPTFKDEFDSRLEYVAGSVKVDRLNKSGKVDKTFRYASGDDATYDVNANTIAISSDKLLNGNDKLSNKFKRENTYVLYYTLKIKDSEYDAIAGAKLEHVDFENKITLSYLGKDYFSNKTVAYPTGVITKDVALKQGYGDVLLYTIDFNPARTRFTTTGNKLKLIDTVTTDNVVLKPNTISVVEIDEDGIESEVPDAYRITDEGRTITFTVPDEAHIRIKYEEKVIQYGSNVQVKNEVRLEGYDSIVTLSDSQMEISRSDASASNSHGSFTLYKSDEETGKPLQGATFQLYTKKTAASDVTKEGPIDGYYLAKTPYSFTTDENGCVEIDHVCLTLRDADTYVLVETKAPKGYELDTTPIEFTFNPKEGDEVQGLSVIDEDTIFVTNKPVPPTPPETPNTSDPFHILVWTVLMIGAALGITGLVVARRKRS